MATRAVSPQLAQLPNALTIARLVAIPIFVVLLVSADDGTSWAAGILFGIAAVTDQIDGYLARRWHVESEFGKYADPLADRLLIDAAVVVLFLDDKISWAGLAIIAARDALMVLGARLAVPRGYEFSVSTLGKAATWVLYAAVGFIIVTPHGTHWPQVVFWVGVGLAVAAAVVYVVSAWRQVRR